jgi:hypothetical protein
MNACNLSQSAVERNPIPADVVTPAQTTDATRLIRRRVFRRARKRSQVSISGAEAADEAGAPPAAAAAAASVDANRALRAIEGVFRRKRTGVGVFWNERGALEKVGFEVAAVV